MADHNVITDTIQFIEYSSSQTFGAPFSFI